MSVARWAERYRIISADNSALPGRYSLSITPYLRGILECITDRRVRKVVCQKSAQIGWTDGVINNYVGYTIHIDPCPIGILFPRDQTAKDWSAEKFIPMVEATEVLRNLVNIKTRSADNTQNRKKFLGGFLKTVGSNSTAGVKSTPLKRALIEEPDDCNVNIKGQGDSIKMMEERIKSYHDGKIIIGGTPTIKGLSAIESEMETSDQRHYEVPCHDCEEAHALSWDNVTWLHDEAAGHAIYKTARPETARYTCPHCGGVWTDAQKNRNVRRADAAGFGWRATAEFRGVAGFFLNELYSPFVESRLERLVEKLLNAEHEAAGGEPGALIAFTNSTLGTTYEYKGDTPEASDLRLRAQAYDEGTVPLGGLVLTMGVDVQHDRLAVIIRAWGRGEESWLVYWGEIFGSTLVALDANRQPQGAWADLDTLLERDYEHATGAQLRVAAFSVDSSDGAATEAVYAYIRARKHRNGRAIKGASEATDDKREIYSPPRVVDVGKKNKASKFGLQVYMVGTTRAKDTIIDNRLKLTGTGPGRMHWYAGVRNDYWEQLTSEVKAPHRTIKHKRVWQKKSGVRNEALDAEVYALHAARSLKTHLMKEAHWAGIEARLRQRSLIDPATDDAIINNSNTEPQLTTQSAAPRAGALPQPGDSEAEISPPLAPPPVVAPQPAQEAPRTFAPPKPAPAPPKPAPTAPRKNVQRGGGRFSISSW